MPIDLSISSPQDTNVVPASGPAPIPVVPSFRDMFSQVSAKYTNPNLDTPIASSEIEARRYPLFNPLMDNEEAYAQQQGSMTKAWNGLVKGGATAVATFAQGMLAIPELLQGKGYKGEWSADLDVWRDNTENTFPNYYSNWEKEHPLQAIVPFMGGGANFWFDKFVKNTGFTIGAIGSAIATDFLLTPVIGTIASIPGYSKIVGQSALRMNKIFSGTTKLDDLLSTTANLTNSRQTVASIKGMAELSASQQITNNARYLSTLYGASHTEAAIEARDGYNTIKEDLLSDFKREHGFDPSPEDLTKIEQTATAAGNVRYAVNLGLLIPSNILQFNTFFRPFTSIKNSLKTGIEAQVAGQTGKIGLKEAAIKEASDIDNLTVLTPKGRWNTFIKKYVPSIFAEGVYEEGGQFAAQKGIENYFKNKYGNPEKEELDDKLNSLVYGLGEEFGSTEGLENILLGGLTGGMFKFVSPKIADIRNKKAGIYSEKQATEIALARLNDKLVTGLFQDSYDNTAKALKREKDIKEAVDNNDIFKFKNLKSEAFFDFISSGIKAGRFDVRIDQLSLLKELPNAEFNKLFGIQEEERESSIQYIDTLISKAQEIKKSHDAISNIFQNPYTFKGNATTEEAKKGNDQYLAFEDYKTALTQFSFNGQDFKSRLADIQLNVSKVSPLLTNNLVADLTNPHSLRDLFSEYDNEAADLQKAVNDKTLSGQFLTEAKEKIKHLNTLSRKIKEVIKDKEYDATKYLDVFTELLNFEANNRNVNQATTIPKEMAIDLITYGNDVNRINSGIQFAQTAYNFLFSQEGFDDFMKNHAEWRDSMSLGNRHDDDIQEAEDVSDIKVDGKDFEVGRSYARAAFKEFNIRPFENIYQVIDATGSIVDTFPTKEEAEEARDYENKNLENLATIKILGKNEKGLIEVEDLEGKVQLIDPELLKGYIKILTEAENVELRKAHFKAIEDQLLKTKEGEPEYITGQPINAKEPFEFPKKSEELVYSSTTYSAYDSKEYTKRLQHFLEGVSRFEKKDELRSIIVTEANQASLGLNIIDYLLEGTEGIDRKDVKETPVVMVFVRQNADGIFYVSPKGEAIATVGEPVKTDDLVFGTMSDVYIHFRGNPNDKKFRANVDDKTALTFSKAWQTRREELLKITDNYEVYNFGVSRGIPIYTENDEETTVTDSIIDRDALNNSNVLLVSTGSVVHNGENIPIQAGKLVLQYGYTMEPLQNKQPTNRQINNIYNILVEYAVSGEKDQLNQEITDYLRGIFYFRKPDVGKPSSASQLFLQGGFLGIGETARFPFTKEGIIQNEDKIKEALSTVYFNANNKILKNNTPFRELTGVENGVVKGITWKTYQHFLVSDKYDIEGNDELKGKTRSIEEIPFVTNIRKKDPSIELDNNYKYKYAFITTDNEGQPLFTIKKEEPVPIPTPKSKYTLDGATINTFTTQNGVNIRFTALKVDGGYSISLIEDEALKELKNKLSERFKKDDEGVTKMITDNLVVTLKGESEPILPAPTLDEEKKVQDKKPKPNDDKPSLGYGESEYSRVKDSVNTTLENLNKTGAWFRDNLDIPLHRVENLIKTTDGGYAYGKFEDGAVYIYRNAKTGTTYHEAFEAVWAMFTDYSERVSIIDEFKNRQGSFEDFRGNKVDYNNSTYEQAKEQIADEFAHYVETGKMRYAPKAKGNFIYRFITDLINYIRKVIYGVTPIETIFRKINSGYYKGATATLGYDKSAQYSRTGLAKTDEYRVVQGITISIIQNLLKSNRSLTEFETDDYSVRELFGKVKKEFQDVFTSDKFSDYIPSLYNNGKINKAQFDQLQKIWNTIDSKWPQFVDLTREYLRTFGIIADITGEDIEEIAEDEISFIEKESEQSDYGGKNADSYVADSFRVDLKKNMSTSIRLLINTLPESVWKDETKEKAISALDPSTQMQVMVNASKTVNFLLNQLYNLNTYEEKKQKLLEIAKQYPNYQRLVARLRMKQEELSIEDWDLNIAFYGFTSKQKPEANTHFIDRRKSVITSRNLNLSTERQVESWLNRLKTDKRFVNEGVEGVFTFNGAELSKYSTKTPEDQQAFLSVLGIDFTEELYNKLNKDEKKDFATATNGLKTYLSNKKDVIDITSSGLDSKGNFTSIADLYIKATGEGEYTFYGIEGERRQQLIPNNTISNVVNDINNAKDKADLIERLPQLDSHFSDDSVYLNRILFGENGKRTDTNLTIGYNQGIVFTRDGNEVTNANLSAVDRVIEEINQNLVKNYYILIPADSKTEWTLKMDHVVPYSIVFYSDIQDRVYDIFNNYYKTEEIKSKWEGKDYKSTMYPINGSYSTEDLNRDKLFNYINGNVKSIIEFLRDNLVIKTNNKGISTIKNLNTGFMSANEVKNSFTEAQLEKFFFFTEVNYMINNIELHKLFFGDINDIKDPLKRYKSFLSPRETALYNTPQANKKFNEELNNAGEISLNEDDYGYWNYKEYMNTVTIADVDSYQENIVEDKYIKNKDLKDAYKASNSTDAQAWAFLPAFREILRKNGARFKKDKEELYQFLMAQDRLALEEDGHYEYTNKALKAHDTKLVEKGYRGKAQFEVVKPVGSGYTVNGATFLHKTSLAPLTYSMVRYGNLAEHYVKMWKQGITYMIVESGTKIGAGTLNTLYTEDGQVNTEPYNDIIQIPHRWFGVQTETANPKNSGPLGTQASKLASVNLRKNGVPIDYEGNDWKNLTEIEKEGKSPIYKKIKRNNQALIDLQNNGYQELVRLFGIEDNGTYYSVPNKQKVVDLLKDELFRRDAPDNVKDAIQLDANGDFVTPIEAISSYQKIKDILYSYVNKLIAKPRLNGGAKIQISGAGWEHEGRQIKTVKVKGKDKLVYVSNGLKFYSAVYDEAGNRTEVGRMEILLPSWFRDKLRRSKVFKDFTDDEVIAYLNKTEQGKKILNGVGFRIPTQEINSIEVFTVKGFLPDWMGSAVVVPEAITTKAGSDFDVDKLQMYLKNVFVNNKGEIALVPYLGAGEDAISQFRKRIDEFDVEDEDSDFVNEKDRYIGSLDDLEAILDKDADRIDKAVNKRYKQSLENEYFESLEDLLLLPQNYERLIKPNSADKFKDIRDKLVGLSKEEFGFSDDTSVLNRQYMSTMRHLFIVGKGGVGIGAVAQTNNSINQSSDIYVNPNNIGNLESHQIEVFKKFPNESVERVRQRLENEEILKLPHNTTTIGDRVYATLSNNVDKDGEYISDKVSRYIDGFVDIAKDPWISQIIQSPSLIGTYLVLEKLGVPDETVAMFMNQPIIREFIKLLALKNTTWFYNGQLQSTIKAKFPVNAKTLAKQTTINVKGLSENIRKFYNGEKLNEEEKAQQHLILQEFLKASVLAQNLFDIHRGTSYDTDNVADPNTLVKKKKLTLRAANNNIFSSVEDLLNNTHLGNAAGRVEQGSDAIGESLTIINKPEIKKYINRVIDQLPKRLSQDAYRKATRAIEESFITYLIQTNSDLNNMINELMISPNTAVGTMIWNLKKEMENHPNADLAKNIMVQELTSLMKNRKTELKNVTVLRKVTDSFTSDVYTGALRELRANPLTHKLYKDLVNLSFLQSGISNSPISIKDYIPQEDYSEVIKFVLDKASGIDNMEQFVELGMFFRNQWSNRRIVPTIIEEWDENNYGQYGKQRLSLHEIAWFNNLKKVNDIKDGWYMPFKLDSRKGVAQTSYITMTTFTDLTAYREGKTAVTLLLQRLEDNEGNPIYTRYTSGNGGYYTFIPINPLGDSFRLQEYYDEIKPSIAKTSVKNIQKELPMKDILNAKLGIGDIIVEPQPVVTQPSLFRAEREYTPENVTSLKENEIFVFGSNTEGRHGKGAALTARNKFGAIYGQPKGRQGQSYAIVTKDLKKGLKSIPLETIKESVKDFLEYSYAHPELKFYVPKIGSSLAGHSLQDIKGIFQDLAFFVTDNVVLPKEYEFRTDTTLGDNNITPEEGTTDNC